MYDKLKKIYDHTTLDVWGMATAYLLDKGFSVVQNLTDEQIEKIPGNGIMTQDFCQNLVRIARDIAQECGSDVVELIQFCQVEKPFSTEFYAPQDDVYDDDEDENCVDGGMLSSCSDVSDDECNGHCFSCSYRSA